MIIRKNTLWKKYVYLSPEVRVLIPVSPCTYPHKYVYFSDPFPERGKQGVLLRIIIKTQKR